MIKSVFFGTPDYVIPIIDSLHKKFRSRGGETPISAVVTQKPKPVGRKQILSYSAVDTWAHKKKIPIYFDAEKLIKDRVKADLGIIAAYGDLLPKETVNYFPHGILVVHPSLLPQFRWGSPVQATIVAGTNPTGVTIIKMDEKFDHGPIISQFKEEVLPEDTTGSLRERLFERSAEVLTTLIPAYLLGKITPREQEHDKATFARMITKEDAFIPPKLLNAALQGLALKATWKIPFIKDFSIHYSPVTIHRFIRAMLPWPGAWTLLRLSSSGQSKRLKILKAHLEPITNHKLILDEVQLEGKNPVTWKQFIEGYPEAKFV